MVPSKDHCSISSPSIDEKWIFRCQQVTGLEALWMPHGPDQGAGPMVSGTWISVECRSGSIRQQKYKMFFDTCKWRWPRKDGVWVFEDKPPLLFYHCTNISPFINENIGIRKSVSFWDWANVQVRNGYVKLPWSTPRRINECHLR